MSIAALIRRMAEAGAPLEAIAMAVEAIEASDAKEQERKAKQRERTAKSRSMKRDGNVTVTPVSRPVTAPPQSPLFLSPTPPNQNPPIPPISETNVSGVAAPNVIVLADSRAELFDRGLKTLAAITGKPDGQCRGLIGRWLKTANDDAVRVLRAIEDAARGRVADAVPWIEAALKAPRQTANEKPDWVLHREKMQRWL